MIPSNTMFALRSASGAALRRPLTAQPMGVNNALRVAGKRWNTQEQRGGKSKLIFRFGLRDIPVELYPMAFVVGAACVGAGFAVARHFYLDGLRITPARKE